MAKQQVLVILGSTATGKTSLALQLASRVPSLLISADSRQVYTGMDIGTGKDIPQGSTRQLIDLGSRQVVSYQHKGTQILGYDLVSVHEPWSVAQHVAFMQQAVSFAHMNSLLPIIVGGTGFYIQSFLQPPETLHIKPNPALRKRLQSLSLADLQAEAQKVDSTKFTQLNNSDSNNTVRLIRLLEVATSMHNKSSEFADIPNSNHVISDTPALPSGDPGSHPIIVGLSCDKEKLKNNIANRIKKRIIQGIIDEIRALDFAELDSSLPARRTLGYTQVLDYIQGRCSVEEAKQAWLTAELQYAKRQSTWFKKMKEVLWFDSSEVTIDTMLTLL